MPKDICIVGAGMAGLAAAKVIRAKAPADTSVTVYEALGRIGGRAFTETINGEAMDWGCEALEAGDKAPTTALCASGTPLAGDAAPDDLLDDQYDPRFFRFMPDASGFEDITHDVATAGGAGIIQANIQNFRDEPDTASDNIVLGADLSFGLQRQSTLLQTEVFGDAAFPGTASLRDVVRAGDLQQALEDDDTVAADPHYPGNPVYFREGLGRVVATWANDVPVTTGATVTRVAAGDAGKVNVTRQGQAAQAFDGVLVTVPSNIIANGRIQLPDLDAGEIANFGHCPLGYYFKATLAGIDGITMPPVARRIMTSPQTLGNQVQLAHSPGGRYLYCHASGETAFLFGQTPDYARAYMIQAFRALNPEVPFEAFTGAAFAHTLWQTTPQFGGAYSHSDINQSPARAAIQNFNKGAIYFAGEACSTIWYGQLAGAMESGQRMADRMITDLGLT